MKVFKQIWNDDAFNIVYTTDILRSDELSFNDKVFITELQVGETYLVRHVFKVKRVQ